MVGVVSLEIDSVGQAAQIQCPAQGKRHKLGQQVKQQSSSNGKGKGQQVLPVALLQGPHRSLRVQQFIHCHAQNTCQSHQGSHVRVAAALPPGHRLIGHSQLIRQFLLGHPFVFPVLPQTLGKFLFVHRVPSPLLFAFILPEIHSLDYLTAWEFYLARWDFLLPLHLVWLENQYLVLSPGQLF